MYGTLSAKSSGELVCVCTGGASVITPLATSTYNRKKSNFPIDPSSEIADTIYMELDPNKCPIQIVEAPNAEGKMFFRVREYLCKYEGRMVLL